MALYAVDAIDDAIDATKRLLLPFSWGRWLRLGVVMIFVGGGTGLGGFQNAGRFASEFGDGPGGTDDAGGVDGPGGAPGPPGDGLSGVPTDPGALSLDAVTLGIILAVVGIVLLLAIVFGIIGATMEFVFIASLTREEVHVRRYFRHNLRRGVRLFGFLFLLDLLSLLVFVAVAAPLAYVVLGPPGTWTGAALLGALVVLLPLFLVYVIVVGNVKGFTTVFVVPIMIHEDRGVLSSWGRLWGAIKREWKQFLAYAFFGFVLAIGTGLVHAFALFLALVGLGIPALVLGIVALAVGGTAGMVLVAIVAGVFVLALVVAALLFKVPLQSFLRYYALFVLGDADEDFDLIPEIRADVRA